MGVQYLTDRPELRRDRGKIFDEIQNGIIKRENILLNSGAKIVSFSEQQVQLSFK